MSLPIDDEKWLRMKGGVRTGAGPKMFSMRRSYHEQDILDYSDTRINVTLQLALNNIRLLTSSTITMIITTSYVYNVERKEENEIVFPDEPPKPRSVISIVI